MYKLLTEDKDIKTDVLIPIDCTLQGYFDVLKEATAAGWKLSTLQFDFIGIYDLEKALYGSEKVQKAFLKRFKNTNTKELDPILFDAVEYLEENCPANQKVSLVLALQVTGNNSETANYVSPLSEFGDDFKRAIKLIAKCANNKEMMMMVIAEALGKTSISYTEEQAIYKFITENSGIHT